MKIAFPLNWMDWTLWDTFVSNESGNFDKKGLMIHEDDIIVSILFESTGPPWWPLYACPDYFQVFIEGGNVLVNESSFVCRRSSGSPAVTKTVLLTFGQTDLHEYPPSKVYLWLWWFRPSENNTSYCHSLETRSINMELRDFTLNIELCFS